MRISINWNNTKSSYYIILGRMFLQIFYVAQQRLLKYL